MAIPEDFLHDWWSFNYDFDFFRSWLQIHDTHGLEAALGYHAFQEAGCSMNVEAMNQLPYNFTPVETFGIGSNSMPSHLTGELPLFSLSSSHGEVSAELSEFLFPSSNQEGSGELPQLLLPYSQGELLTSVRAVDVASANCPEVGPSMQSTSKPQYTGFSEEPDPVLENLINSFWLFEQDQPSLFGKSAAGESSRNMENLPACGEGNTGMNEFAGSPPALRDDDNTSETSDGSSSFRINTADADASTAHQLESNEET